MRRITLWLFIGILSALNAQENLANAPHSAATPTTATAPSATAAASDVDSPAPTVSAPTASATTVNAEASTAPAATAAEFFAAAEKAYHAGNYQDALPLLEKTLLAPDCQRQVAADALTMVRQALQQLDRVNAIDAFLEKIATAQKDNWRVLTAIAEYYNSIENWGTIIDGVFQRTRRGNNVLVNCEARDRVRALQLMQQASELLKNEPQVASSLRHNFYVQWADLWRSLANDPRNAWRLQMLTDISTLPDYVAASDYHTQHNQARGAPVLPDGQPVLYYVPESFAAAKNDGERWRWCLAQGYNNWEPIAIANFAKHQFGLATLSRANLSNDPQLLKNIAALPTLTDNEMLAQLANGVARFTLPDEFAPLKIWQKIFARNPRDNVVERWLAQMYQERTQYAAAVQWYETMQKVSGDDERGWVRAELAQLTGNWAEFLPGVPLPAGSKNVARLKFRNAQKITFHARKIKVKELLNDTVEYIRQNAGKRNIENSEKMAVNDIGRRLVYGNEKIYIGEEVATWEMDLTPYLAQLPHHSAVVAVALPENLPTGGYLLEGKVDNGNTARIVIWLADTAIVKKQVADKILYYVADATTGAPRPQQKLTAWGYGVVWQDEKLGNKFYEKTLNGVTDENGCVTFGEEEISKKIENRAQNLQWLITTACANANIHSAYLGFTGMWVNDNYHENYGLGENVLFITDRPLYRPNDKVQIKGWWRTNEEKITAGEKSILQIVSPTGEKFAEAAVTLDDFGGFTHEFTLPADAKLGAWNLTVQLPHTTYFRMGGGGTFRVEEYQKPEYEVTVSAPSAPVALGEAITATVSAKYYFGEPVKNAKVAYKVVRYAHSAQWFAPQRWDWLYGNGYWWFADNYAWFPGWARWGCRRPYFAWWGNDERTLPPELVMDATAPLNENGELKIVINTENAKLLHPDLNQRYEIQVAVTDESRRVIDGRGSVLVAKQPFTITAWTERGFYEINAPVKLLFKAQTLDNQPIARDGEVTIYHVTYNEQNAPQETIVKQAKIATDNNGNAEYEFIPPSAGQYRGVLAMAANNSPLVAGNTAKECDRIEGGYLFTVCGVNGEVAMARFNPLEIIPEKMTYQIGEKCRLQINTAHENSTVLLFLRGQNGVAQTVQLLPLKERSGLYEFTIAENDQPNIFVEALVVRDAKVYTAMRQIAVPPASKILTLNVLPEKSKLSPSATSKLTVKLTDENGNPFRGQAVLTMYDKSLEYISGGSNVPDIRRYFWGWVRQGNSQYETNLHKRFYNLAKKDETRMATLSPFEEIIMWQQIAKNKNANTDDENGDDEVVEVGEDVFSDADMGGYTHGTRGMRVGGAYPLMRGGSGAPRSGVPALMKVQAVGDMMMSREADNGKMVLSPETVTGIAANNNDFAPAALRSNFADTAVWRGVILTDDHGEATIDFTLPDSLTTWKIRAWAMGAQTQVAQAESEIITYKNLLLRLQAPRFLVVGDTATFTANIHNYLSNEQTLNAEISLGGECLKLANAERDKKIIIPAGGEQRVDWQVTASAIGTAEIIMRALGKDESDAVKITLPVNVHGIDKMLAHSGVMAADKNTATFDFTIPEQRRVDETRLEIRYSPSLALAMIDALPYLIEYPHGCTEQTLNKFLPLVITQNTLKKLNINLADVKNKITNLNAQAIGDDQTRAAQWKKSGDKNFNPLTQSSEVFAPVFDAQVLQKMVEYGVQRLTAMQCADGGWGWFSGYGEQSYPHTTAIVVRGLLLARENGALIPGTIIDRGVQWLKNYQAAQTQLLQAYRTWQSALATDKTAAAPAQYKINADNLDALIYSILAVAEFNDDAMTEFLFRDKNKLTVYGLSLYALGLFKNSASLDSAKHRENLLHKYESVMQNIAQYLVINNENQTAYLQFGDSYKNCWWYWYGSEIEANAIYLQLLAHSCKTGEVAAGLVKYLINNRQHATYWNSTRDTAMVIEAFADYLTRTGEAAPAMTVSVSVNGKLQKETKITAENLFTFDNKVVLTGADLASGKCTVEITRRGTGKVYFNAYLSYFSLADNLTAAGSEIKVQRRVYRLVPANTTEQVATATGAIAEQGKEKYDKILLNNGDAINSGDLLAVELILTAANDYEYLMFSDHKPAGCEPLEVRSGYHFGDSNSLGAYIEFRTATVDFFIRQLNRGTHNLTYRTRAIYPGTYSALPTLGAAMYAPELKCNSDEIKIKITE